MLALLCRLCLIFLGVSGAVSVSAAPVTVIFGGDLNYPPYEWQEEGKAEGFLIDLEDELARAGNARAEHHLGP